MQVEVNGTRLWFDVDSPALIPDGREMRQRSTVVLVHGGPASYDHSYFKPEFKPLAEHAQVVYLDLRGHGRSDWGDPAEWSFEACADDIRVFCDAVGIERPIVFGHSMGVPVVLLYGARHPGHAAGLVAQSGFARLDIPRLVDGFRRFGGDKVAELARRSFSGDRVTDAEWSRVFAVFGPRVPDEAELTRRRQNRALGPHGTEVMRRLDVTDQLGRIDCPTLVCVGELDPVTPVAASEEIFQALPHAIARLEVLEGAGHFPWKDVPGRYWPLLADFVTSIGEA
jgi:pimeloyl-ACP methyl ester carboxylesterase